MLDGRVNAHNYYFLEELGKFRLVPDIVATLPQVRQMLAQPTAKNIEASTRILEETARNIKVGRIFVMDVNGTVLAADQGQEGVSIIGENYRFRPYFEQAISGQTGHYIAIGKVLQVLGYIIARPVVVDGKVLGVAAVRVSLSRDALQSIIKRYWEDGSELALLADEHGVIFMSPIDAWIYKTIAPLPKPELNALKASRQYMEQALLPISIKKSDALGNEIRLVQFDDIPDRVFVQKSYPVKKIHGRIYLHVNASHYWKTVATYTTVAALTALITLLTAVAGMQRWAYRTALIETAIRDPLTGLYTRLYMNEWIQTAMRAQERDPAAGFALAIFDLDHFKQVNDTYGHLIGDQVLKAVGQIIVNSIRAEDLAVRFGGEEFAVFVRAAEVGEALTLSERIRQKLERSRIQTDAGLIPVTMSGGIAYHTIGETSHALFARADEKLYQAKELGRNRICA